MMASVRNEMDTGQQHCTCFTREVFRLSTLMAQKYPSILGWLPLILVILSKAALIWRGQEAH